MPPALDYEPRLVPVHELKVPYNHAKFLGGDAYYCPWFGKCAKRPAIFMGTLSGPFEQEAAAADAIQATSATI